MGPVRGFTSTQGYGHSTVKMACEVAYASEAGQLVLFHHDPSYSDAMVAGMEASAKAQISEAQAAYEGLEILIHSENSISDKFQSPNLHTRDVKYANND